MLLVRLLVAGALTLGSPAASYIGVSAGSALAQRQHDTCDYCHNLHGAGYEQLVDFARAEDLCMSCHQDGAPLTYNGETIPKGVAVHAGTKHVSPDTTSCRDCHDHEGEVGNNLSLIPLSMDNRYTGGARSIVFEDTTDFADGDATYDGVCEVCHTGTSYHRQDGGMPAHNPQRDCVTCHGHDTGFAAAGGSCTDCHNGTQGSRRAVVAEFDRASHHAASPADSADCTVCHDQSQHQAGSVRLWDVDDPGNTAASIVLSGDPNTSATEAALLARFCLSCHDSDGAAGDTSPFSDAVTVPAVDSAAWTAASHNRSDLGSEVSCYGDGTFGCHISGHGSEKLNMLAPDTVAATAPANAEQEEGFCLNCHDSDGPSSVDLNTAFSQAINWVQTATGLNSNPNLNDRHDIQYAAQQQSGAKIECTDCHDPHTATSDLPFVLDPDTADAHVPGTDWYYYAATSDTLSEFCLDCHDGSFPTGVLDHTSPQIVNIQSTWAADGMGARTGSSVDLRAGNGWAIGDVIPCQACHTTHMELDDDIGGAPGTPSLFRVVDTVRNKAGDAFLFFKDRKASDPEIYAYGITNNLDKSDVTSGGYWCNTCHVRLSMTGKENCYGCHRHGDGGRF
jgi:predicted CXXCH cytochrome family protein